MTKTKLTKNGRKVNTFVQSESFELSFTRPTAGAREATTLNITSQNPATGETHKVRLNGRQVAQLRKVLA